MSIGHLGSYRKVGVLSVGFMVSIQFLGFRQFRAVAINRMVSGSFPK